MRESGKPRCMCERQRDLLLPCGKGGLRKFERVDGVVWTFLGGGSRAGCVLLSVVKRRENLLCMMAGRVGKKSIHINTGAKMDDHLNLPMQPVKITKIAVSMSV